MGLILNIETSTTVCSVCLADGTNVLSARSIDNGYSHAENLTVFIEDIFKEAGKKPNQLDAVAVSSGPGSYTGLRIGTSTAKGLCYALDIPLLSISSLEALAHCPTLPTADVYVPMIDARRMEVYTLLLDQQKKVTTKTEAKIIDEESYLDLEGSVCFFGNGAMKCEETIQLTATFVADVDCSAEYMVGLSHEKFEAKQFEDTAYFEPFYLKDFVTNKPKKKK